MTHLLGKNVPLTCSRQLRQLVGRYRSCLLRRHDGGNSQIQVNGRFLPSRWVTLYYRDFVVDPLPRDDRVDGPTEAQLLPPRGGGGGRGPGRGRGPFRSATFRLLVNLPIPLLMQKASYESLALQRAKRQN